MKLLFGISFIIFSAQALLIPDLITIPPPVLDLTLIPVSIFCFGIHRHDLSKAQSNFEEEFKNCFSSNHVGACEQSALLTSQAAGLVIHDKIQECLATGNQQNLLDQIFSDVDGLLSQGVISKECWLRRVGELLEIKETLLSELLVCTISGNLIECPKTAVSKATTAALEVRSKIRACIEEGEEQCFSENRSQLNEATRTFLFESHDCRSVVDVDSNEAQEECFSTTLTKAETAVEEVREEVQQCIQEGSTESTTVNIL